MPLHDNGIKMTTADSIIDLSSQTTTSSENHAEEGKVEKASFQAEAKEESGSVSFAERVANSGVASAAAMATAAVNAAVSMKTLSAPDTSKSYIALSDQVTIDEDGLPLVYDREAIETYWKKEKGALKIDADDHEFSLIGIG